MTAHWSRYGWAILLIAVGLGCPADRPGTTSGKPAVPPGYLHRLEIDVGDRILTFGPFVGYYFKPASGRNLHRLDFICFNERSFYTRDLPTNARLFEGQAQLHRLAKNGYAIPVSDRRIIPLFFANAPVEWLDSRPPPQDEYVHFHSAYDGRGAVRYGYWLRHVATASFTYDMGGRVTSDSPLYHVVQPGPDRQFAQIIEFDHGPSEPDRQG